MMTTNTITPKINGGGVFKTIPERRCGAGLTVCGAVFPRPSKGGLRHKGMSPLLIDCCGGDYRGE